MRTTKVATRAVAMACVLSLSLTGCAAPATTDETVEEQETVAWATASSAAEAADAAGIKNFGVPSSVSIADIAFTNPTFSYTKGVVQATYESGAAMLYIRKAESTHTPPLTERDTTEFTNKWTKNYGGLDVTSYGFNKEQATLLTWKDGARHYACTYQGLGGEELWMDDADARALVANIETLDVQRLSSDSTDTSLTSQSTSTGTNLSKTLDEDGSEDDTSTSSSSTSTRSAKPKTSTSDAAIAQKEGYIEAEDACAYATDCINATDDATNIEAKLVNSKGAPHYEVTFDVYDERSYSYTVLVGATDGAVWDIEETELSTSTSTSSSRRSTY